MADRNDELLPCPFCGSLGDLERHKGCGLRVVCQNINCRAEVGCWQDREEFAIKAWNTRKAMNDG